VRTRLWADDSTKWAFVAEPAGILGQAPSPLAGLPAMAWSLLTALLWPFLVVPAILFAIAWCRGGFATALVVGAAVFLAELGALYYLLRRKEKTDVSDDTPPTAREIEEIMKRESFMAQNHLAATSTMKPGAFRRLTLRVGLWVAGTLAGWFSVPGHLATTTVIHFARWILLPGTDQLLFYSNFDGTWERYLEDFIELASGGVNGIWSNTRGFPRTNCLFVGGSRDGDRLRRWTRRQQYPSRIWYSAYADLTLPRIRTNAAIRQGIALARTEEDAADWLSCFGSSPRPSNSLQTTEIPTLVFGGLRPLRFGTCILVRLAADVAATKSWLAGIEPQVCYGDTLASDRALIVAFSWSGLRRLGVTESQLATFPIAFQHGVAAPWRSRVLGDEGRSAPQNWQWGGPGTETDAVVLVYAADQAGHDQALGAQLAALAGAGHQVVRQVKLADVPPRGELIREPFGFVDGISDPKIRGTRDWMLDKYSSHLVEAGEFVLGYPDNLGYLPSTPTVEAGDDPDDLLPALADDPARDQQDCPAPSAPGPAPQRSPIAPPSPVPDQGRQRPSFSPPSATGPKDLGCNGTFLVVRQLEQDTAGFNAFLDNSARELGQSPRDPRLPHGGATHLRDWLAAKTVGRWQEDGTSLMRHPHRPGGGAPDNEFLSGTEDPNGLLCPFGAHMRRANPRDSLKPGDPAQLAITNRHRLLRVGRKYLQQGDLANPGLIFMCLNVDIERQFEFVQQTWILQPSFMGLQHEADPLLGGAPRSEEGNIFTVPTAAGPLCLKGLKDFVTVKGAGYFFMPGRSAVRWLAR